MKGEAITMKLVRAPLADYVNDCAGVRSELSTVIAGSGYALDSRSPNI